MRRGAVAAVLLSGAFALPVCAAPPVAPEQAAAAAVRALPADAASPPSASKSAARPAAVTLAYKYRAGETYRQTTRQIQSFSSDARPDVADELVMVARVETRVLEVDPNGSAVLDEVTTFEEDAERRDHKRFKTNPQGEVLWADIVQGDELAVRGGALLLERPVSVGESWTSRLKGGGSAQPYEISLNVKFASLSGEALRVTATLKLSGRMDAASVTAMLGADGAAQGLKGKECAAEGEVRFEIESGRESASSLAIDCVLEMTPEGGVPVPAFLRIAHETTREGSTIPSIPSP